MLGSARQCRSDRTRTYGTGIRGHSASGVLNLGNSLNFDGNGFPNQVHDNQITYNHIYRLGQGVTSDMGAVHTATGLSTGNTIEYNSFHDITHDPGTGGYGGWGIYFDQGSSFLSARYNLVYNTSATGFTYNHSQTGTYQFEDAGHCVQRNNFRDAV